MVRDQWENVDIMTVPYFILSAKFALFCAQFTSFIQEESLAPCDTYQGSIEPSRAHLHPPLMLVPVLKKAHASRLATSNLLLLAGSTLQFLIFTTLYCPVSTDIVHGSVQNLCWMNIPFSLCLSSLYALLFILGKQPVEYTTT